MSRSPVAGGAQAPQATARGAPRSGRRTLLAWAFALGSAGRIAAYVPTMAAILATGDSSQHSLWTWATWLVANLTMAAWLYEEKGHRLCASAWVATVNAAMCMAVMAVIAGCR